MYAILYRIYSASMASIIQRRKRFIVVYRYEDENGKRKQKWETFKTNDEAKRRGLSRRTRAIPG